MTFERCQAVLTQIRRLQGTRCPLVRIDYGGLVFNGRLTRSDSDADARHREDSPYGVLVLQSPGLAHQPETLLQIAEIPDDGIRPLDN